MSSTETVTQIHKSTKKGVMQGGHRTKKAAETRTAKTEETRETERKAPAAPTVSGSQLLNRSFCRPSIDSRCLQGAAASRWNNQLTFIFYH